MESFPINTLNIEDKNYPEILRKIPNPPKVLFWRGKLLNNETCFAIVGTRRYSSYGKEIAFSIAEDLAEAGLTIVSGMARGIDTFSHKGALEGGGRTIAVLGTGLDEKSIFPRENLKLARKILENGGALISEYPPGAPGMKQNFPERNRIISGMSIGVLVVEANFGSGALITAKWAREQNKKVFAVPGSIYSLNSRGCHFLIKQGAKLVESANDILKELNLPCLNLKFKQEIKGETKEESLILEVLRKEPLDIDKIIEKTNLSPSIILTTLAIMEIKGKVKNLGGNIFALAR